jgi:hypothetical protein
MGITILNRFVNISCTNFKGSRDWAFNVLEMPGMDCPETGMRSTEKQIKQVVRAQRILCHPDKCVEQETKDLAEAATKKIVDAEQAVLKLLKHLNK